MSKDKHYWAQLRAALTSGAWSSPTPARAPNGTPLSWSELLRKFNKHCHGFRHVAEVAEHTQALAILLAANFENDEDEDRTGNLPALPLDLEGECVLPQERIEEATVGYNALKELQSTDNEIHFVRAYYAYALDDPAQCIAHLADVSDLLQLSNHIPGTTGSTGHLSVPGGSARVSLSSASVAASYTSLLDSPATEIKDGRAWAMTEVFRSICLLGMSHERLQSPSAALETYHTSTPLFTTLTSDFSIQSQSAFPQLRELWRWVERLLWRAVVLSSRSSSSSLWMWLNHYDTASTSWPATFRTAHRSTICTLHLRALVLKHRLSPPPQKQDQPAWVHTARQVVQDYRAILSSCTSFPKAGEQNTQVEEFVDLCVAIWEAAGSIGEGAGWVIDILWWSTRLTFNSPRTLRHLTRLLYLSGDTSLAKKSLQVYTQVVSKAYQAAKEGMGEDVDTDRNWVEMMIFGARMLCVLAEGKEEVREAGRLVELAKGRLSGDELKGGVEVAEGVCYSMLALKEQDPYTRPTLLSKSHTHFLSAITLHPTPDAHFHLALSYSRSPNYDLEKAIEHAGQACEGDSGEVRYWHLLGLLLTAAEKWEEARVVFEMGAEIDDGEEGEDEEEGEEGVKTVDFATGEKSENGNGNAAGTEAPLPPDARTIPPASGLLKSILDKCPQSKEAQFEAALQLRMSQVALAEVMEGPEGAEERWVDVFAWVAERKGKGDALPRASLDLPRPHDPEKSMNGTAVPEPATPTTPIPITISAPEPHSPVVEHVSEKKKFDGLRVKRSLSIDRGGGGGGKKKVGQMLKHGVHKGHAGITAVSRKVNGVVRNGNLKRSSSTPDFNEVLRAASFQASSIHSRRRVSSVIHSQDRTPTDSPPPPPLPPIEDTKPSARSMRENKLLSELWLMSSATFRRLGKIEQAKGAIQEAEVRDEGNPAVWVQLGLYYVALGHRQHAIDAFQKALFIDTDDVSATVHLSRLYLEPGRKDEPNPTEVDLATGLLAHLTKWTGWDVPEAWYFLAKAYKLQNRKEKEREALKLALKLSEQRGVREIGTAIGWCI